MRTQRSLWVLRGCPSHRRSTPPSLHDSPSWQATLAVQSCALHTELRAFPARTPLARRSRSRQRQTCPLTQVLSAWALLRAVVRDRAARSTSRAAEQDGGLVHSTSAPHASMPLLACLRAGTASARPHTLSARDSSTRWAMGVGYQQWDCLECPPSTRASSAPRDPRMSPTSARACCCCRRRRRGAARSGRDAARHAELGPHERWTCWSRPRTTTATASSP
mmetsp:Transcript_19859/g.42737  ORF Transcript_19859/g.42737 Transcript_19859/m.42737 type:complete len:221 (-) Transcript_19859:376-1038(-)